MTQSIYMCPRCGGGALDIPYLDGAPAVCAVCGWSGPKQDLVVVPVATSETDEDRGNRLFKEFSKALVEGATVGLARVLAQWGLLPTMQVNEQRVYDPKALNRYMFAIAKAGLVAALQTARELNLSTVEVANDRN